MTSGVMQATGDPVFASFKSHFMTYKDLRRPSEPWRQFAQRTLIFYLTHMSFGFLEKNNNTNCFFIFSQLNSEMFISLTRAF